MLYPNNKSRVCSLYIRNVGFRVSIFPSTCQTKVWVGELGINSNLWLFLCVCVFRICQDCPTSFTVEVFMTFSGRNPRSLVSSKRNCIIKKLSWIIVWSKFHIKKVLGLLGRRGDEFCILRTIIFQNFSYFARLQVFFLLRETDLYGSWDIRMHVVFRWDLIKSYSRSIETNVLVRYTVHIVVIRVPLRLH